MFDRFAEKLKAKIKKDVPAPPPEAEQAPAGPAPPPPDQTPAALAPAAEKPSFMRRVWTELNKDVTEVAIIGPSMTRLRDGLKKTREGFVTSVQSLLRLHKRIDADFWEELWTILISADVGTQTSDKIVEHMKAVVKERDISEPEALTPILKEELGRMLEGSGGGLRTAPEGPTVIMVVGVNGAGKTTSIGKLASQLKAEGKKVILGGADTFRAAAIDQLAVWAQRVGVEMVPGKEGSDPAAVAFDALAAGKARGADVIIVDTAGRLHSKVNLMEELKKLRRVMQRQIPDAPHEVLLVLDATNGQNALQQARTFGESVDVTGIVLAKLDGTAKGGIVLAIADELEVPVKYIGIGEAVDDLRPFDPARFLDALFASEE
jgi:fused signal recognition particle receptor